MRPVERDGIHSWWDYQDLEPVHNELCDVICLDKDGIPTARLLRYSSHERLFRKSISGELAFMFPQMWRHYKGGGEIHRLVIDDKSMMIQMGLSEVKMLHFRNMLKEFNEKLGTQDPDLEMAMFEYYDRLERKLRSYRKNEDYFTDMEMFQ